MESFRPIVLEVDFTPDDLRHFFHTHNKRNARGVRFAIILCTFGFFAIAFRLLGLLWGPTPGRIGTPPIIPPTNTSAFAPLVNMLMAIAPYLGALAVLVIVMRVLQRVLYTKAAEERNPYQRHHTMELTETHVVDSEPLSRHEFEWSAFNRWAETSLLLTLYVSANSAVLIPKRAFASAEELDRCRGLLRAMIDTPRTARNAFPVQTAAANT